MERKEEGIWVIDGIFNGDVNAVTTSETVCCNNEKFFRGSYLIISKNKLQK
jgi:hypothetical protein